MKAILGTLAVSVALPIALSAQVASGGAAAGSAGAAGVSPSAGVAGSRAVSPSASLAGQTPTLSGTATTPSGTPIGTPGTAVPVGPINPGGISGQLPQTVGRTFDRSTIGGGPTDTIVNPAGNQPTFRFPPSSTLTIPAATNTIGGLPPSTFPGAPVGVNNTVGTNFGTLAPSSVPREPVAINLPPGARVLTNVVGVPEVVVPPPSIVGTNIGAAPGVQRGTNRVVIPRTVPPQEVPRVSRGPILDSLPQR